MSSAQVAGHRLDMREERHLKIPRNFFCAFHALMLSYGHMIKTKSIVRRNLILSLVFGLGMGIVFPLYASIFVEFKSPTMEIFFIVGCLVAGLVVGFVTFYINNRTIIKISERIVAMIQSLNRGENIDFSALATESDDSIGALLGNFRDTLQYYYDTLQERKQIAEVVFRLGKQIESRIGITSESIGVLNRTVDLIGSAADELDIQSQNMEKSFDQVNKSTLLNVSNVIELFANINEFGKTIFSQSETLEQLLSAIVLVERQIGTEKGIQEKNNLVSISVNMENEIQSTIDTSSIVFAEVRKNLDAIGGIAERTNVLSINASIESARLGKDGAGFRIISTNIKQLSSEVQTFIDSINKGMDSGEKKLAAVTEGLKRAIEAQVTIVGSIRNALRAIGERSGSVSSQSDLMLENRSQIDGLLQDVRTNMQNLKEIVSNTRISLNQVVETAQIIRTGITTLTDKSAIIEKNEKIASHTLGEFSHNMHGLSFGITAEAAHEQVENDIPDELESI